MNGILSSDNHMNIFFPSHYYHPSQIPPSILQMHGHPTTTYEHPSSSSNNNPTNTNNSSQIPVIAAAAQAILEQNNVAAAAFAANAFYRFQHQQQPSFHQTPSMVRKNSFSFSVDILSSLRSVNNHLCYLDHVNTFIPSKFACLFPFISGLQSTNSNLGQQLSNPLQQRAHKYDGISLQSCQLFSSSF